MRGSTLRSRWASGVVALAALWPMMAPEVARACSVCSAGRDEQSQTAFLLTTAFLTILPLLGLGAGVWWLVRRARALEARAAAPPREGHAAGAVLEG